MTSLPSSRRARSETRLLIQIKPSLLSSVIERSEVFPPELLNWSQLVVQTVKQHFFLLNVLRPFNEWRLCCLLRGTSRQSRYAFLLHWFKMKYLLINYSESCRTLLQSPSGLIKLHGYFTAVQLEYFVVLCYYLYGDHQANHLLVSSVS